MSLPHAILALLQNEEASGYDLTRHFAQSADHVWSATHQQIYLELGKLHRAGKVDFEIVHQSHKPDKKLYRITPLGNEALHGWLQRPAGGKRVRESLLIKILASHLIPTDSLLEELRLHRAENEQALSHYQVLQTALGIDHDNMSRADKSAYLSLRRGIIDRQAWLDWANEAEALLGETETADHA
ncbi:MAG: PadR family transcriptional regulator [Gammaproteobacteria bacterium]|nr:PadR family transcriptional regulator [Gammaproteobacteria bacterium]MBQ0773869.1 PadR family transcriptional regulator [Gammaproteobacteria bacterium]